MCTVYAKQSGKVVLTILNISVNEKATKRHNQKGYLQQLVQLNMKLFAEIYEQKSIWGGVYAFLKKKKNF